MGCGLDPLRILLRGKSEGVERGKWMDGGRMRGCIRLHFSRMYRRAHNVVVIVDDGDDCTKADM